MEMSIGWDSDDGWSSKPMVTLTTSESRRKKKEKMPQNTRIVYKPALQGSHNTIHVRAHLRRGGCAGIGDIPARMSRLLRLQASICLYSKLMKPETFFAFFQMTCTHIRALLGLEGRCNLSVWGFPGLR
jgi:hypothetical protein